MQTLDDQSLDAGERGRAERGDLERAPLGFSLDTSSGAASGLRLGELPAEIEERLGRWLSEGAVPEGEEIKAGRVFRFGSWAVKFFEESWDPRRWIRRSAAVRTLFLSRRLLPIATPQPLVALEQGRGLHQRRSLLVSAFVEGLFLDEAWDRGEERAVASFPSFMADMHRRGVFHGDLHLRQLIWNGSQWVLLDVDGMRHGMRTLLPRRLIENHWARVVHSLRGREGLRAYFERYLDEMGSGWERERAWRRVMERFEVIRRERAGA